MQCYCCCNLFQSLPPANFCLVQPRKSSQEFRDHFKAEASRAAETNAVMRGAVQKGRAELRKIDEEKLSRKQDELVAEEFHYASQMWITRGLLGQGGNGSVFRIESKQTGLSVALKTQKQALGDGNEVYLLADEFRFLSGLRHPHIITVCSMVTTPRTGMVMELGNCDLHCWLQQHQLAVPPDTSCRQAVAVQLVSGLHFLAGKRLLHCDVKTNNAVVFLGASMLVKWSDFGCMREMTDSGPGVFVLGAEVYTPGYRPVEMLSGHSKKARFSKHFVLLHSKSLSLVSGICKYLGSHPCRCGSAMPQTFLHLAAFSMTCLRCVAATDSSWIPVSTLTWSFRKPAAGFAWRPGSA